MVAVAGTTRHITKRKQLENTLRQLAADLTEADCPKDEFLATLAYKLHNLLTPIRVGLELMQTAGENRAMMEEVRAMMKAQIQQLGRLVDHLLDVFRITSGKGTLGKEQVALASVKGREVVVTVKDTSMASRARY